MCSFSKIFFFFRRISQYFILRALNFTDLFTSWQICWEINFYSWNGRLRTKNQSVFIKFRFFLCWNWEHFNVSHYLQYLSLVMLEKIAMLDFSGIPHSQWYSIVSVMCCFFANRAIGFPLNCWWLFCVEKRFYNNLGINLVWVKKHGILTFWSTEYWSG